MVSRSFQCGARLPDGSRCDATVSVKDAKHIYREDFADGGFEQILDEIHYAMECPRCGPWKRVETVHISREMAQV